MGATLNIERLDRDFGAIIHDVDVRTIDDDVFAAIHDAWITYGVIILPGQFLTQDEQNAFALRFGDLEFPAAAISNLDKNGNIRHLSDDEIVKQIRGNEGWHHDSTYMPVQAKGAVVTADIVTDTGAATGFADMRAAYDRLDEATKQRLEGLQAYHSLWFSMDRVGYLPSKRDENGVPVGYGYHGGENPLRPLVKVHPETGRKNLNIGRHAHNIVGWDPEESQEFIDQINADAVWEENTYFHQWALGDAVVWDNRRMMHRATPFDFTQPRRIWHTRIAGDPTTESALNAGVAARPADQPAFRQD